MKKMSCEKNSIGIIVNSLPEINIIKKMRKTLHITQKELGEKLGLPQSLISRIENGITDPPYSNFKKIYDFLFKKYSEIPKEVGNHKNNRNKINNENKMKDENFKKYIESADIFKNLILFIGSSVRDNSSSIEICEFKL